MYKETMERRGKIHLGANRVVLLGGVFTKPSQLEAGEAWFPRPLLPLRVLNRMRRHRTSRLVLYDYQQ